MTCFTSFPTSGSNHVKSGNAVFSPELTQNGKGKPVPVGTGKNIEYQFHFAIVREHSSMKFSTKKASNDVEITQNSQNIMKTSKKRSKIG